MNDARRNAPRTPVSFGVRTQAEVAAILGISRIAVRQAEWRALRRLRRHPLIRCLAEDAGIPTEESP